MGKTYVETFVAEVTSLRAIEPAELERILSKLSGVLSVNITNPIAEDHSASHQDDAIEPPASQEDEV